jgi:hypothetical protein
MQISTHIGLLGPNFEEKMVQKKRAVGIGVNFVGNEQITYCFLPYDKRTNVLYESNNLLVVLFIQNFVTSAKNLSRVFFSVPKLYNFYSIEIFNLRKIYYVTNTSCEPLKKLGL